MKPASCLAVLLGVEKCPCVEKATMPTARLGGKWLSRGGGGGGVDGPHKFWGELWDR